MRRVKSAFTGKAYRLPISKAPKSARSLHVLGGNECLSGVIMLCVATPRQSTLEHLLDHTQRWGTVQNFAMASNSILDSATRSRGFIWLTIYFFLRVCNKQYKLISCSASILRQLVTQEMFQYKFLILMVEICSQKALPQQDQLIQTQTIYNLGYIFLKLKEKTLHNQIKLL